MALRVYALLARRGLSIPEDISVVGYDDYPIIAEHLHPSLSTVKLPYFDMGVRAAERLLDLISRDVRKDGAPELIASPAVWRESAMYRDRGVAAFNQRRRNRP